MTSLAEREIIVALAPRFQRGELANHADLSAEGRAILGKARGPSEFIIALVAAGNPDDIATALAFVLPKRQGVWWACLAARLGLDAQPSAAELEALRCAEAWVVTRGEEARAQAEAAATALDHDGAAAWAALAAFWSGDSIAPAGLPEVPPPSHLTAKAVKAALCLSANASAARGSLADLCAIGLDILAGQDGHAAFERIAVRHATHRREQL